MMTNVIQAPAGRGRVFPGAAVVIVAALAITAVPRRAAADEDDWQLGARAGVASVVVDHRDPLGVRAGLDGQYGLTDAWAIRLTGSLARIGVSGGQRRPDCQAVRSGPTRDWPAWRTRWTCSACCPPSR